MYVLCYCYRAMISNDVIGGFQEFVSCFSPRAHLSFNASLSSCLYYMLYDGNQSEGAEVMKNG